MTVFQHGISSRAGEASVTCFLLMVLVVDVLLGAAISEAPTAKIVVRVRRRRTPRWDVWQLNSNVCPPSLCRSASEGSSVPPPRPRGTGGSVFYQGDIVLDKAVDRYIFPEENRTRYRRATVRLRSRLWKDGVVPYVFGDSLSSQARRVIVRAFAHISKKTCIVFRKKKASDKDFVKFISEPGCWSAIGQTGKAQLLSLGRGCENIGTAVHEITHSLGAWHEQARRDRNNYVRIIDNNISDRFLKDFERVSSKLTSSRGFPYDYHSIMHYSRYAFTRNGKPTIEVIGIGKKLGLTIKQREGLSTIDMAQLRDMYRCNLRQDTKETSCPKGWYKHDTDCYRFFELPKVQFAAANRKCKELNSHLVWIESKREDQFLARHLQKKFPFVYTWRTGGRSINGTMKWFRKDGNSVAMDYTNWGNGHPGSFSTMVLHRNRTTNETQWEGVWAGSVAQQPFFMYPFVCERRAKRKCLKLRYKDGRDYRGKLDHTIDGYTCQKWTEQYPHQHKLFKADDSDNDGKDDENIKEDADGLGNHNFCRNPKKQRRSRPWCYTTKKNREWQLCDVTACSTSGSSSSRPRISQTSTTRVRRRELPVRRRGSRQSDRPAVPRRVPRPPRVLDNRHDAQPSTSSGRKGRRGQAGKGKRQSKKRNRSGRKGKTDRKNTREHRRNRKGRRPQ